MWRKSNMRHCLSICLEVLGNTVTNLRLASIQVEIYDV
jgi:hypothetical protein